MILWCIQIQTTFEKYSSLYSTLIVIEQMSQQHYIYNMNLSKVNLLLYSNSIPIECEVGTTEAKEFK
jgi:hypothetical protein